MNAEKTYAVTGTKFKDVSNSKDISSMISFDRHTPVSLYVGQESSGKSLALQQHLRDFCAKSQFTELPFVTLIHDGQASDDFIGSLGLGLGGGAEASCANLVVNNTKDSAINIFDIQVGLPKPLCSEQRQIKAFLMTLFTPCEQESATDGIESLVNDLVSGVFAAVIGKHAIIPKLYEKGINTKVDEVVSKYALVGEGYRNSFFELANRLHFASTNHDDDYFEQEELTLARDLAHSLAMPVMSDLLTVLSDDKIIHKYSSKLTAVGEPIVAFARRMIEEAVLAYPSLSNSTTSNSTTLSRGEARMVSINLQAVIERGNHRQNSLFLQAARAFALKPINIIPNDLLDGGAVSVYEDHYKAQIAQLNKCDKIIAVDGLGLTKSDGAFAGLLEADAREFRKLGINLTVGSDNLVGFGERAGSGGYGLLGFTRKLFIFSVVNDDDRAIFNRYFASEAEVLSDLASIDDSTYFSYEIFSAVPIDSVVKTALNSK